MDPASDWPTAIDVSAGDLLILPVGAFEQHGPHLPLATDTVIANILGTALRQAAGGIQLPAIPVSCSHEHLSSGATLTVGSRTAFAYLEEIVRGAFAVGLSKVAIINAHGGNYFLGNLVQELNAQGLPTYLGPGRHVMERAFVLAEIETPVSDDMHGGEYETSVMLAYHPDAVRMEVAADVASRPRPLLTTLGMLGYTDTGIIGRPTLATAAKGRAAVGAIADLMARDLRELWGGR